MCDTNASLEGKVAIVTGGGSGVGFEAAKNLANLGARVIIASRNETKLQAATHRIRMDTGNNDVSYGIIDLASLNSVRNFVHGTLNSEHRLDILVNNAGAVNLPDRLTEDGLHLMMQVNYFGVFLLTYLLLPLLKASQSSRIINVTAGSMYIGTIDFSHWNDVGRYSTVQSLANSKLADALFTVELDRRLQHTGVTANSFDPFLVPGTDVLNNMPDFVKRTGDFLFQIIGQPKEVVGKQITYLAVSPHLEKVSGRHYKFCREWFSHWLTSDENFTRTLWNASKKVVKITDEEDWEANFV